MNETNQNDKYISIQESAKVSGKSIQTIRRAIKSKRIKFKKKKTPQGFNYSISQQSLCELYKLNPDIFRTNEVSNQNKEEKNTQKKSEVKSSKKIRK